METLYPIGYGTRRVTLAELKLAHLPGMHPGFGDDLFAWLVSMNGLLGIGSGDRACPHPVSAASRACKSFHQYQTFASGIRAYSAVDLVAYRGGGSSHRAPTWGEVASAKNYGLHAFIEHEPWHVQDIRMRGYQTWVDGGRQDPPRDTLPPPPPDPTYKESNAMKTLQPPRRKYDSRYYDDRIKMGANSTITLGLREPGAVAVMLNITVTQPENFGFVTVWDKGTQPDVSNLNYNPGQTIANSAIVPVAPDGSIQLYSLARTHVIVDVQAVFTAEDEA